MVTNLNTIYTIVRHPTIYYTYVRMICWTLNTQPKIPSPPLSRKQKNRRRQRKLEAGEVWQMAEKNLRLKRYRISIIRVFSRLSGSINQSQLRTSESWVNMVMGRFLFISSALILSVFPFESADNICTHFRKAYFIQNIHGIFGWDFLYLKIEKKKNVVS